MTERNDPYRRLRFLLEIEGVVKAGFSHCDLPAATSGVVRYREGNELPTPRKLPGLNGYGPLVLRTGVTDRSIELAEWRTLVERGKMAEARRPVAVTLLDATGLPAARWEFRNAWPSRYEGPRLSATQDDVAIERLVVVNEGFGRVAVERPDDEDEEEREGKSDRPVTELPTEGIPRITGTEDLGELFSVTRRPSKGARAESEET